ncbi:long-chain fatty acid--CoA ligase [Alicyclobacillus sp.]|uniref:AMP-dependent synthetase/ligase n=1 Tax=Alicyclobacillus sp. TaxID=61169 RepID=UPI0025C4702D|nr:long-chain fatty acid--CoA ligase [Alicyclobacillus sp.]MCL6516255.1 long-chain fatty acid--CoA ligase [Alicyclobacillus sp.]
MNLVQSLERAVLRDPDHPCLMHKTDGRWQVMTYGTVWEHIQDFAAGIRKCGVRRGDRVALLATNRPEWAIADYALLALGAVVVPVYPTLPRDQVLYILENAEVSHIILEDAAQYQKVMDPWPERIRLSVVMRHETMPRTPNRRWLPFWDVVRLGQPPFTTEPVNPSVIPDEALATIVHTSGTSGHPKGVMLSHRNIVSNVEACLQILPVDPNDVSLSYLPLSHIFERTVGQFAALSSGATVAYAESIDALRQNLTEVRPTILITVPRLLEKVYTGIQEQLGRLPAPVRRVLRAGLDRDETTGLTYRLVNRLVYEKLRQGLGGRLRVIVSGGAALSPEIARFYTRAGIPVHEGYGMTEAAPVIAANPADANRPGTVGVPIPGVEIRIAEDGELLVRGPNVMQGYYRAPEETAKALEDGWLHTGDIAVLEDGYLRIVDRKKNILVLATGKNVAPAPVETAIALSPYVSSAVLIGDGRKYVTCLVSPDLGALTQLAQRLHLTGGPADWIATPQVRALFAQEIRRAVEPFASFEQPKRALLLPEEFSVEGGQLTPTLKVRNRIIMQRYGDAIERMYEGTEGIPIFDPDVPRAPAPPPGTGHRSGPGVPAAAVAGSAPPDIRFAEDTAPGSNTAGPGTNTPVPGTNTVGPANSVAEAADHPVAEAPAASARRRRRWAVAGGIALCGVAAAAAVQAAVHGPAALWNIPGLVRQMAGTNDGINGANRDILNHLRDIDQLAGRTGDMVGSLQQVNTSVARDQQTLARLNDLSRQEVDLSQQFLTLARAMQSDMNRIGAASNTQARNLGTMRTTSGQVVSAAAQLTDVNRTMAGKLDEADRRTHAVNQSIP